jgi:glycosyltransferase involved in cell wall biosynthesis
LKILFVIPYFFPYLRYGGPVTATYSVLKELSRRGHDITVVTTVVGRAKTPAIMTYDTGGLTVNYLQGFAEGVFFSPRLVRLLPRIRGHNLVHLNSYRNFPCDIVHLWARKERIPTVISAHGSILAYRFQPSFPMSKKFLYRLHDIVLKGPVKHATVAVAVSSLEARHYEAFGVSPERIRVVPNCVDLDKFSPGRPEHPLEESDGAKLVGYVGRLDPIKGLVTLLDAFELVQEKDPQSKLMLVGPDFGMKKILRSVIANRSISGVIFKDPVPYSELVNVYRSLDVVVSPSSFEVFGMSTLEAMACGRPVVSTGIGGTSDLIEEGYDGYLVRPGDHEALASRILNMLQDKETAKRIGKNAWSKAQGYGIDRTADLMEEAYEDCLSKDTRQRFS